MAPTTGGAGGGGAAVVLSGTGTVTNDGTLTGGLGGNAKNSNPTSGQGGSGGEGVWISNGGTLVNSSEGKIIGGAPAPANHSSTNFPPPAGGVGVVGTNATVVNAGMIGGGSNADAIQFIGGVNSLEIQAGSTINGNVVAFSTADTLKLGGDTDASFDASTIGTAAQYQGFGQYQKTGTSTWTLTGTSTEAMPWTVQQGTLAVDGSLANSSFTVDNAALTVDGSITGSSFAVNTGTITVGATGAVDNSSFAVNTGGVLAVNGSAGTSAVAVNAGGTLRGSGTVGATTVHAGGTIAPGNSIGTLNVNGAYVQEQGAVYQAEVDPTSSASDRIAVTGTATIQNGAIINVTKATPAPYVVGSKYSVLTATNGVNGTFNVTGDTSLSAFLALEGTYDARDAFLEVKQTRSIGAVATTPNQAATASGLDSLGAGAAAAVPVVNQQTDEAARTALNQLSGEIHASVQSAMLESSHFARDVVSDRLTDTSTCPADGLADPRNVAGGQTAGATGCGRAPGRPTGWARFYGNWGHTDGDGNASRLDSSVGGFFVGADMALSDTWRAGVLTGYSHGSYRVSGGNASADSDDYHLGVYGGAQWGALGLRTGATYTWHDISADRQLGVGGFSDHLSSNYNAGTSQVFGELGYKVDLGRRANIEPFLNLAYVNQHAEGFNESGGADALHVGSQDMDTGFSTLGLRGTTHFTFNGTDFLLKGMVGWRYAVGDVRPVATESFQGGASFDISGVPIARNQAVVDLGVGVHITRNATISLSYNGQFSSRVNNQGVLGALNIAF
ncbi:MAG TPA: autotransporter domain-containing protein [Bordetella sp.]|nr:autotransporter domain-containing protein [Bordetella sp.]